MSYPRFETSVFFSIHLKLTKGDDYKNYRVNNDHIHDNDDAIFGEFFAFEVL